MPRVLVSILLTVGIYLTSCHKQEVKVSSFSIFQRVARKNDSNVNPTPILGMITRLTPIGSIEPNDSIPNFNWNGLASGPGGEVFVGDNSQHCIRVFNTTTERQVATFGNRGKGPAEFEHIVKLKYVGGYGLIVLDNLNLRVSVFDDSLRAVSTINLDRMSDDIAFTGQDEAFVSSYFLREDYKPIRRIDVRSGKTLGSFGVVAEVRDGITHTLRDYPSELGVFSFGSITRLLFVRESKALIYSQRNPYVLLLYRTSDTTIVRFDAPSPFSTCDSSEFKVQGEHRIWTSHQQAVVLEPHLYDGARCVILVIFDSTSLTNFLDCYDYSGTFLKRISFPALSRGVRPIASSVNKAVLYLLVRDASNICWIERFDLIGLNAMLP